jgi:UDP-N-acetylmuramoyl-L-alanyl-D-glutamate--2,6-diaminopimelate ligase
MRDQGVDVAAVEVSSHALEYGRVAGTRFAVAAFTNISQDHLDFHGDMAAYRAAKERLFTDYEVGTAVINIDDPVGADIAAGYDGDQITVGRGGDFSVYSVENHATSTTFTVETPMGVFRRDAPVIGEFNVANLVLAAACCVAIGLDSDLVFDALPEISGVPGRFEVVSGDDPITVIVDYAHTPEGVATVVRTASGLGRGRVIALLGAGGDRDRAKRPAMGGALSRADYAIVTSDNPRSEDPEAIADAVLSGVADGTDHVERGVEDDQSGAVHGIALIWAAYGRGRKPPWKRSC